MMYHKGIVFGDLETANEILQATSPNHVRTLGRQVSGFDQDIWDLRRYDVVLEGNKARFRSSASMKKKLMATGDKILVEASPFDKIWGVGFGKADAFENRGQWGLNLLGQALMDVRDMFRDEGSETSERSAHGGVD